MLDVGCATGSLAFTVPRNRQRHGRHRD
jgi:hypothetical protein